MAVTPTGPSAQLQSRVNLTLVLCVLLVGTIGFFKVGHSWQFLGLGGLAGVAFALVYRRANFVRRIGGFLLLFGPLAYTRGMPDYSPPDPSLMTRVLFDFQYFAFALLVFYVIERIKSAGRRHL